jgi:hypothetical protein
MNIMFYYWMGTKFKDLKYEHKQELLNITKRKFNTIIYDIIDKNYYIMIKKNSTKKDVPGQEFLTVFIDDKRFTQR